MQMILKLTMLEYMVIEAKSANGIKTKVTELIQKGWMPQGGIATMAVDNDVRSNSSGLYYFMPTSFAYSQAMIKEPKEPKEPKEKLQKEYM